MTISNDQKIDYLWKKIGYGRAKTDTATIKDAVNESISSALLLRGDNVWAQSNLIPATIPVSSTSVVTLYPTSLPIECTADITSSTNRTWKTNIADWIPPEIGATYLIKVYVHTSGNAATAASSGTQLVAAGSGNNDEWFFDYQSGTLNFIGTNLPSGINFTGKSVYISGAVYSGIKGVPAVGSANTFTNLDLTGNLNVTGIVTAASFVGDGSGLTGITAGISGITIKDSGTLVGSAGTIDFGTNLTVSPVSAGVVTVTASGGGTSSQWVTTSAGIHTLSNVGVGTTNPTNALTVVGSGASLSQLYVTGVSTFGSTINAKGNINFNGSFTDVNFTDYLSFFDGVGDGYLFLGYAGNPSVGIAYADEVKLQTIGTGVTVTGTTFTNQLSVSGVSTFGSTINANGDINFSSSSRVNFVSPLSFRDAGDDNYLTLGYGGNPSVAIAYQDNPKLATIGTGVTVFGTTFTNQLNVSGVVTATSFSGSGSNLTSLDASNISSGTVATARLASGTADSTTYLRGDQTWASISAGGATLSNDTTTDASYYPTFSSATSGTYSTAYVSDTKCTFNPSTGTLSATQFTSLSDKTQKTNIRPIDNSIELTKQLQGVRFDWIDNDKPSLGLIAQDVEKVLPELVETNSDGIKSVSYSNIVGVLIEAIKEQQIRIEELERKLNA